MNAETQIKKGRKYDQVIEGARAVFMREGFEGASVDVIARDAGVSKATLYSYFPDKQQLFLAVLQVQCDTQKQSSMDIETRQLPVAEALHHIATSMLSFILSEDGLAIFRVCVGEAKRFPELGRAFYETGPCAAMAQMSDFMQSDKAREMLDIDDPAQAADTFMQLCRTDLLLQRLMGVCPEPTAAQINEVAIEAVKTFMARYARP
ncbi:TetR/AcrR family transcriptional regulator [Rhodophyticola sp. CCM32]|uniref:TetR/AcrR family transcriptional regulator n=1 Tax=Rhodophyticola sp. CCM32 TaxID=2916397 RepID=UPI00107F6E07|nr:TetR/AcrR family transcriptional regulator [Rhodophyticola sp. CCM32]QBY02084.1 TetR/AcrR family transcriptional regulator [Rhodophyticola sp. CCM32]